LSKVKQRLDWEAVQQRPSMYEAVSDQPATDSTTLATDEIATPRTPSSAEYIVSEIKKHKLAATAVVCFCLAAAAGMVYLVYRWNQPSAARNSSAILQVNPLTSAPGRESQAALSVDGKQIAFTWDGGAGNNLDIYVKPVEAGTPRRLTTDPAWDHGATW